PSADTTTSMTYPRCPVSEREILPVAASQIFNVPSPHAEIKVRSFGNNRILPTPSFGLSKLPINRPNFRSHNLSSQPALEKQWPPSRVTATPPTPLVCPCRTYLSPIPELSHTRTVWSYPPDTTSFSSPDVATQNASSLCPEYRCAMRLAQGSIISTQPVPAIAMSAKRAPERN